MDLAAFSIAIDHHVLIHVVNANDHSALVHAAHGIA